MYEETDQLVSAQMQKSLDWMIAHGWKIGLILLAGLVAWIVAGWLGTRLSGLFKRNQTDDNSRKLGQTLGGALRWTLRSAVLIVATVLVLNQLGVNVKPVIYKALDWLITQGPGIVFTLILGFVALKVATLLAAK